MTWFVVSLHDVAPRTALVSRRWMDLLVERGLSVSMLVVPGPWHGASRIDEDSELAGWLRELSGKGHEIVQHGWEHSAPGDPFRGGPFGQATGRLLARGCAEFWTLDSNEARRRLDAGRSALRAAGLDARGFVAPAWLLSSASLAAVEAAGFDYTTTHRSVIDFAHDRRYGCAVLSQRPGSPITGVAASAVLAASRVAIRSRRPIRIAAHPADLEDPVTRASVLDSCEAALAAGYRSLTYADLVHTAVRSRPR